MAADPQAPVRRVVTGHDPSGKAVFASDEVVAPVTPRIMPGSAFHLLWNGDEPPRFPDDGSQPPLTTYFPPVGGFRFGMFTIPPESSRSAAPPDDVQAGLAELERALPGMLGYMETDAPGMHTTDTVDFEIVLSGECWLELDDGAEVHLRAGDTVVQNGTRHAWHNRSDEPCQLAVFIVGAHHDKVPPPA